MKIRVGIGKYHSIRVVFNCRYVDFEKQCVYEGEVEFKYSDLSGAGKTIVPMHSGGTFTIGEVSIGIGFHWQQRESQTFSGILSLTLSQDKISVVNEVDLEKYLESVVSSEMSADSPLEYIKAHAVIARSWVLRQIASVRTAHTDNASWFVNPEGINERCIWYDHTSHLEFDVCADDHCQRYQGVGKVSNPNALLGVRQTEGEILSYNGEVCDTRFSKCCGGAFEKFSNCWQPADYPYLKAGLDASRGIVPDLSKEENAADWIEGSPDVWCGRAGSTLLRRILNNYDLGTSDFFRWKREYTETQIDELVTRFSPFPLGHIEEIEALQRGVSGRISRLHIKGDQGEVIVGKELEIRRWLSATHLYSSAFTIVKEGGKWIIKGAGWGHGVGFCQIGAAAMAAEGYDYKQILSHYYPGAELDRFPEY